MEILLRRRQGMLKLFERIIRQCASNQGTSSLSFHISFRISEIISFPKSSFVSRLDTGVKSQIPACQSHLLKKHLIGKKIDLSKSFTFYFAKMKNQQKISGNYFPTKFDFFHLNLHDQYPHDSLYINQNQCQSCFNTSLTVS